MAEAEEPVGTTELKAEEAEMIAEVLDPNLRSYNALSQAPFIITSLGHLLLISGEKDFSLMKHTENTTFQYIKYPDSFRACLVQLSNNVWNAFDAAHHSMNRIRMKSINIDEDVEKAVYFIENGTTKEFPFVSQYLDNIEKQSTECVDDATTITNDFKDVADMMKELLEACTQSKGKYEHEQNESERNKNAALEKKEQIKEKKKKLEDRYKPEKKEMEEAKEKYKKSVESYPSGWKIKFLRSIEYVIGLFHDIDIKVGEPGSSETVRAEITSDEANAYLAASDILKHAEQLHFEICDQSSIASVKTSFEEMLGHFTDLTLNAGNSVEDAVKEAMELCENGAQISKKLGGEAEDEATKVAIGNRIVEFYERAKAFNSKAVEILNSLSGFKPADENEDLLHQSQMTKGLLTQKYLSKPEREWKEAKELLLKCFRRHARCQDQVLQESKEMENILEELAKVDPRNLDLANIRQVLAEGMIALNKVIVHWNGFKNMFQELHDMIKERLKVRVQRFKNTTQVAVGRLDASSQIMRNVIIQESIAARQIAHVVNSISTLYVNISKGYLLDQIQSLQRIIPLSPDKDREQIKEIKIKLKEDGESVRKEIQQIAKKKKEELSKEIKDLHGFQLEKFQSQVMDNFHVDNWCSVETEATRLIQ